MKVTAWHHLRTLAVSRVLRSCVTLLAAYLLLGWWLAHETATTGLFDASGHPNTLVVALGVVYLVTRLATYFLSARLPGLAPRGSGRPRHRGPPTTLSCGRG